MSGRNPAPRRSYGGRSAEERRAERRERLLTAGLELFGTRGYTATSIERLCATASVSTRNFYEEFTGREELLNTLHRTIHDRAALALTTAYSETSDADLPTRVHKAVQAFVTVTATDPRWARIAFAEVTPTLNRYPQWKHAIETLIQDAITRNEAPPRDYTLTIIALTGALTALIHHRSTNNQHTPTDQITTELTTLIIKSLTP
ncbi:TetR family transcriptional regulator [Actinomadura pelletieri DSM 43383]|uniref:TetR family transcriptional regulator n=1 Tax=Actinomadura pelletieri DSM 43383 TaxID=1120940 RepID=A0A495QS58_9ACTN|nr:TetR/AcrR family transcriptional regulator [Actinomadura pelletieri]RKS76339.1 TetR family transcriptional regulator [Actinomadura pelletieri DSM 43383]